ncbi:unnamed protein product [Prunus brigantina]
MKFSHMWRKINVEFFERSSLAHTEMTLASKWKILNKELGKWRDALAKAMDNIQSGENLDNEIMQAQMWFRCHLQRQRIFQQSPMLGGCEKLFKIQKFSHKSDHCVE